MEAVAIRLELEEVFADYLEREQQDHNETATAVRHAYEDVKAGRTRPAEEFLEELSAKHGFSALMFQARGDAVLP